MRRLNIAVLLILIVLIFFLTLRWEDARASLSFLLLLCVPLMLAHFHRDAKFSAFICLAIILLAAFLGYHFRTVIEPLLVLLTTGLAFSVPRLAQEVKNSFLLEYSRNLRARKSKYDGLLHSHLQLKNKNSELEKKILEVSSLYETARQMGRSMELTNLFEVFTAILVRQFGFPCFRHSKLIMLTEDEPPTIARMYVIQGYILEGDKGAIKKLGEGAREVIFADIAEADKKLGEYISRKKGIVSIFRDEKSAGEVSFSLPERLNSLVAVPLVIRERVSAILVMENFRKQYLDKFLILMGEFNLEIKRVRLYEEIQRLAITDGLTGVYLRRHFIERFNEELIRSRHHNLKLSLLMLDIDHFKDYNDRYGHLVGDVVLRDIAEILRQHTRQLDLVARYGGEEFSVVLPETTRAEAVRAAERARKAVEEHKFRAYDETTRVSVSIGIASFPDDAVEAGKLVECADQALYRAKSEGRNRVGFYQK